MAVSESSTRFSWSRVRCVGSCCCCSAFAFDDMVWLWARDNIVVVMERAVIRLGDGLIILVVVVVVVILKRLS